MLLCCITACIGNEIVFTKATLYLSSLKKTDVKKFHAMNSLSTLATVPILVAGVLEGKVFFRSADSAHLKSGWGYICVWPFALETKINSISNNCIIGNSLHQKCNV